VSSWLRRALARLSARPGADEGELGFTFRPWPEPDPAMVEVLLSADSVDRTETEAWCAHQTLDELRAVGMTRNGAEAWSVGPAAPRAAWFAAPGTLPELLPAHLESCLLVAAAEEVDAVTLRERVTPPLAEAARRADDVLGPSLRPWTLYRADAYAWDPATDTVRATGDHRLVKLVDTGGVGDLTRPPEPAGRFRRGPYLSSAPLGPRLDVGLRDARLLRRVASPGARPAVLVLSSFLARGGAEHTLFETLKALQDRFTFGFATLAPHRATLGDRRDDFRTISERLFCLGDLVHPAAMVGMLEALLDASGAEILYNANGTTLFYDFAPRLKASRPGLRIVDHLYDHRVGYIDRYTPELKEAVDACVAENHRIRDVLVAERGWPEHRVPVIWPCGRTRDAFPAPNERGEVRRRLRRELGYADDDLILLTAARMHPQKRPLDLVALAGRVADLPEVHFLVVGGGDLEDDVDAAIAASPGARIRRLAFRTDIPELIIACDVGCLVSDYEGLPVFMMECLQAGRPFLGTNVGDMGRVLGTSGAGLIVEEPGDLEGLERCVRRLVDPAERRALAERALEVAPRFEVESCAELYARALLGAAG
jgi:glycosyltransferase involved in cell wall biosynthesis